MEKGIIGKSGFILGKFYPPHAGHIHLIKSGQKLVEKLTVLVCALPDETIPGYLRYEWIKEECPDVNVIFFPNELPSYPEEDPENFWEKWTKAIKDNCPDIDVVFTSEKYGDDIADKIHVKHYLVDFKRSTYPVSGTSVRANPINNWEYIPNAVKPYFAKKIVLVGPESCGKTTLTKKLAEYYNTSFVEEYGRVLWEEKNKLNEEFEIKDISTIGKVQLKLEHEKSKECNGILFCDTNLIMTQFWSEVYFGESPKWIKEINKELNYDLYLLMSPDIPWVDDGTRVHFKERIKHFNKIESELKRLNVNYFVIDGSFDERFNKAVKVVDNFRNKLNII